MFIFKEETRQRNYENFLHNIIVKLNLPITSYIRNIYVCKHVTKEYIK